MVFIPQINVYKEMLDLTFIKKFRFTSFDLNAYEERAYAMYKDYLNSKIINVFLIDDLKTLGVISINETLNGQIDSTSESLMANLRILSNNQGNNIIRYQTYYKINLKFYNSNLKYLSYIKDLELNNQLADHYRGEDDIFIKSLYINILDEPYILFIYYLEDYSRFFFDLFDMNYLEIKNKEDGLKPDIEDNFNDIEVDFDINKSPNDFIKISDYQVVFMYFGTNYYLEILSIFIIDINIFYWALSTRKYHINLDNYSPISIKGFSYNSYLLFSSTGNIGNNHYNLKDNANYISMFMIFGYANGTDSVVDISKFIFKENFEEDNNFFGFYLKN